MDPEPRQLEPDDQRLKLEEMIRRKHEVEHRKSVHPDPAASKDPHRYEEIIRDKNRKRTSKEKLFNNAFCVEIKEEKEKIMQKFKDTAPRPENWFDHVIDKERKIKREETRLAQDRLKLIDKRTRYSELVKEILSPTTRAMLSPEPLLPRSSSKKDFLPNDDKESVKGVERSRKTETDAPKRILPRSLSRKETSPYNARVTNRSPFPRQTITPIKGNLN